MRDPRGRGDVFCAGADVAWMRSTVDRSERRTAATRRTSPRCSLRSTRSRCPWWLAGRRDRRRRGAHDAADVAVASRDATLAFRRGAPGILPAVISPYVVRRIGAGAATALFVSGLRSTRTGRSRSVWWTSRRAGGTDAAVVRWVEAVLAGPPRGPRGEASRARRRGADTRGGSRAHGRRDRPDPRERRGQEASARSRSGSRAGGVDARRDDRPGAHDRPAHDRPARSVDDAARREPRRDRLADLPHRAAHGMRTAAVYRRRRRSPFTREADLALRLGPAPARDSYLAIPRILECRAHRRRRPRNLYGFLPRSRRSRAGRRGALGFVGPPADVIAALATRARQRRSPSVGVPVLPGTGGAISATRRSSRRPRDRLPLMVKPVAGAKASHGARRRGRGAREALARARWTVRAAFWRRAARSERHRRLAPSRSRSRARWTVPRSATATARPVASPRCREAGARSRRAAHRPTPRRSRSPARPGTGRRNGRVPPRRKERSSSSR